MMRTSKSRHWLRPHANGWTAEVWMGEDGGYYWRAYQSAMIPPDYRNWRVTYADACAAADERVPSHICTCQGWTDPVLVTEALDSSRPHTAAAHVWEQELLGVLSRTRLKVLDCATTDDGTVGYAAVTDPVGGQVTLIQVSFKRFSDAEDRIQEVWRQIPRAAVRRGTTDAWFKPKPRDRRLKKPLSTDAGRH